MSRKPDAPAVKRNPRFFWCASCVRIVACSTIVARTAAERSVAREVFRRTIDVRALAAQIVGNRATQVRIADVVRRVRLRGQIAARELVLALRA